MATYTASMVDPTHQRFYAISRPTTGERIHLLQNPIRDLAAAWDATTLLLVQPPLLSSATNTNTKPLKAAIVNTLQAYPVVTPPKQSQQLAAHLDPIALNEPSNIAHTAFYLLTLLGAVRLELNLVVTDPRTRTRQTANDLARGILSQQRSDGAFNVHYHNDTESQQSPRQPRQPQQTPITTKTANDLTRGILSQQRPDGAFSIYYNNGNSNGSSQNIDGDNIYRGMECFPAMIALMEIYQHDIALHSSGKGIPFLLDGRILPCILPSMRRAFLFYSRYSRYHRQRVGNHKTKNIHYTIWQIQAFSRLTEALYNNDNSHDDETHHQVAEYVLDLCQEMIETRTWKMLARGKGFYPNLETLEIACGLDALAQGLRVATLYDANKARLLSRFADHAIHYLRHVQHEVPRESAVGYGGLMMELGGIELDQRLDVTGHAASGLIKLAQLRDEQLLL